MLANYAKCNLAGSFIESKKDVTRQERAILIHVLVISGKIHCIVEVVGNAKGHAEPDDTVTGRKFPKGSAMDWP